VLYLYCTCIVLVLCLYCTYVVLELYLCCACIVLVLYLCCIVLVLYLYCSCVPYLYYYCSTNRQYNAQISCGINNKQITRIPFPVHVFQLTTVQGVYTKSCRPTVNVKV
jgi:hypothetical protein